MSKKLIMAGIISTLCLYNTAKAIETKGFIGLNATNNRTYRKETGKKYGKSKMNESLLFGAKMNFTDLYFTTVEGYYTIDSKINKEHKDYRLKNDFGFKFGFGFDVAEDMSMSAKIGLNHIDYKKSTPYSKKNRMNVSYGTEFAYNIVENVQLSIGYDFSEFKTKNSTGTKFSNNQYSFGAKYLF